MENGGNAINTIVHYPTCCLISIKVWGSSSLSSTLQSYQLITTPHSQNVHPYTPQSPNPHLSQTSQTSRELREDANTDVHWIIYYMHSQNKFSLYKHSHSFLPKATEKPERSFCLRYTSVRSKGRLGRESPTPPVLKTCSNFIIWRAVPVVFQPTWSKIDCLFSPDIA